MAVQQKREPAIQVISAVPPTYLEAKTQPKIRVSHQQRPPAPPPPPSGFKRPSISKPLVDEDGNIIIFEGVCSRKSLRTEICCNYSGVGAVSSVGAGGLVILLLFCVLVPLGVYCGRKAAEQWRLYLTASAIFYLHQGQFNINNQMKGIQLRDIEKISALDETTIIIRLKGKSKKGKDIVMVLNHCENAAEFVEAVKKQISTQN